MGLFLSLSTWIPRRVTNWPGFSLAVFQGTGWPEAREGMGSHRFVEQSGHTFIDWCLMWVWFTAPQNSSRVASKVTDHGAP